MQKEATARLKINKLLTDAKWRFFESPAGSANISLENNIKLSQKKTLRSMEIILTKYRTDLLTFFFKIQKVSR